jgi:hypothetical protein
MTVSKHGALVLAQGSIVSTSTTMPISPPMISTSGIVVLRSIS